MKAADLRRPLGILIVDDNLADRVMIRRALEDLAVPLVLHDAGSVDEALRLLSSQEVSAPAPDLIFLDLNLPGSSGHDLLRKRDASARMRKIPTIVISGSSTPGDVDMAYSLCANAYLCKGGGLEDFRRGIRALAGLFLNEAQLPS